MTVDWSIRTPAISIKTALSLPDELTTCLTVSSWENFCRQNVARIWLELTDRAKEGGPGRLHFLLHPHCFTF